MTIHEIAKRLVDYCRKADWESAHRELYATNAKSAEPYATPEFDSVTEGLEVMRKKGEMFDSMVEKVHGISPKVNANFRHGIPLYGGVIN